MFYGHIKTEFVDIEISFAKLLEDEEVSPKLVDVFFEDSRFFLVYS